MAHVLNAEQTRDLIAALGEAHGQVAAIYPGDRLDRQPVHTVYGGAQLFTFDIAQRLGRAALRALEEYGGDSETFGHALGLGGDAAFRRTVWERVRDKLKREPVEDDRIDFEDGYGNRFDEEEDAQAETDAQEMAKGLATGTLPPATGIRVKPLTQELAPRALRTLDRFLATLARATGGRLPEDFVVTLPKITDARQVAVLADALDDPEGRVAIPAMAAAGRGRVRGAHFGTYDYTAGVNVTARWQVPSHPACDFARHVMQVSFAGTGVTISDGATTVMPVGLHRAAEGRALAAREVEENRAAVHRAWKVHFDDVRSSLHHGYYQGWDLHPAQLPTRYAAVFSFFLEGREEAGTRLQAFVAKAAQATLVGSIFDDAATGQGLLNFFLRGLSCGALTEDEALATGLTLEEFRSRSFVKILSARRASGARA